MYPTTTWFGLSLAYHPMASRVLTWTVSQTSSYKKSLEARGPLGSKYLFCILFSTFPIHWGTIRITLHNPQTLLTSQCFRAMSRACYHYPSPSFNRKKLLTYSRIHQQSGCVGARPLPLHGELPLNPKP